ncbi:MAG: CDP-alcohol phosphatidyltransferase family protein [Gammaproteobacteria bacterium]|nr:CDP-alcohol phosphatidyltransferase family protein [Gammaproteobacteria bacterium]
MTSARIIGQSDVTLWGLTSPARLARQLARVDGVELSPKAPESPAGNALLIRADYLFEPRTLEGLLRRGGVLMDGEVPAAAAVAAAQVEAAQALLRGEASPAATDLPRLGAGDLAAFEGDLRLAAPPLLERITPDRAAALEDRLYGASYKGITDFVTKWWWPVPAKAVVRVCADWRISPNAVTLAGLILMLAACWLFLMAGQAPRAEGWLWAGLAPAWLMTFLDTVDGKLARVTVQSSRVGHWLDHGMDILHPPFWYWLWGLSVTPFEPIWGLGFDALLMLTVVGYLAGRIIEGAFHALGSVSLFAWRPFDAYFRLITARRNPCLVILTLCLLAGAPVAGFVLVALWTALSSVVMLVRFGVAVGCRIRSGPLLSWLADPDAALRHPRAHRSFASTRRAYGK